MKEKIIEMLHIQEALDKSFMEYKGLDKLDIRKVKCALRDELGEVNHEMKGDWCYWKKIQPLVELNKVKEELADVWHFSLSLHRLYNGIDYDCVEYDMMKQYYSDRYNWDDVLASMCIPFNDILYECIILTEKLGFTFDEMYDAYMEKNKENYERMKRGY